MSNGQSSKSETDETLINLKEGLSAYLQKFANNRSLNDLLTLHSSSSENLDRIFVIIKNGKYSPISEGEIRNYIRLTRSVSRLDTTIESGKTFATVEDYWVGFEGAAPDPYIGTA
jgi:hypothetical protein